MRRSIAELMDEYNTHRPMVIDPSIGEPRRTIIVEYFNNSRINYATNMFAYEGNNPEFVEKFVSGADTKWKKEYLVTIMGMTNEEVLDEYTSLSGGDDYDGCMTQQGQWKYDKITVLFTQKLRDLKYY